MDREKEKDFPGSLQLNTEENPDGVERAAELHPFLITPFLEKRIEVDSSGALKRQFYPSPLELGGSEGLEDPIGDLNHSPFPGLVHRYPDRVLLLAARECFANCRFCFRRCTLATAEVIGKDVEKAAAFIRSRSWIREVILSGGDPLTLSNERLSDYFKSIQEIGHVGVMRIHTRAPVVNPARVDEALLDLLEKSQKPVYCVLHINHPAELAEEVVRSCQRLVRAGVMLLSQTVLLKGVNDSAELLSGLMRALVENRIKPYYLHNCDPARGTDHFRVELGRGRKIVSELRNSVSGICMPQFMVDIPHGYGKVPAGSEYVREEQGKWSAVDAQGRSHDLPWA